MALRAYLESPAAQIEGRRQSRRKLHVETSGLLPTGQKANVTIHNISAAGLLIETDLPLKVGEALAVDVPNIGPVGAEIVWESGALFGCAFQQALGEADLASAQLKSATSAHEVRPLQTQGQATAVGDSLGIRLNRIRRERGLTLAQVASALGVSKPTVWAWEKGKAKPLPERIGAIAQVLDVDQDALTESSIQAAGAAIVAECRVRIASAYGTPPESVRIMIEV